MKYFSVKWFHSEIILFQQVVSSCNKLKFFHGLGEQVDYQVPSHAHSAGNVCIIFDTFDCSEISLKYFHFNTEPPFK